MGEYSEDVWYLDPIGTITMNHNGKRVLYYALVVQHPREGKRTRKLQRLGQFQQSPNLKEKAKKKPG